MQFQIDGRRSLKGDQHFSTRSPPWLCSMFLEIWPDILKATLKGKPRSIGEQWKKNPLLWKYYCFEWTICLPCDVEFLSAF